MKQTSLFRSWSNVIQNNFDTLKTNVCTFDNDEDKLVADALDKFDETPTNSKSSAEIEQVQINQFITNALKRTPIIYRPTSNDADNLDGFDNEAGQTWVYPNDSNLREYQLNIIEQCLFKNTLVCLPTGLGKTFIAAVVMCNFLRWYPTRKVVFMAPTRPLVTQQLNACSDFIGSFYNEIIELTGSIAQAKRKALWTNNRVIFLTPQVLVNDLQSGVCPATSLCLLIFDEAHKATGNHAYCQVLRILTTLPYVHRQFRIVALSATPASDIEGVQTLIANLLISHLELRTDTSADVQPYTQHRHIETVVVPLGPELSRYRDQLIECIRIPLDRLYQHGALASSICNRCPDTLATFTIVKAREEWSARMSSNVSSMEIGAIQSDFSLVICLLHALELLIQHGLRPVYRYLDGVYNGQKASALVRNQLSRLPQANQLWSDLARRFSLSFINGVETSNSLPTTPELLCSQAQFVAGHPKLDKLKTILSEHFNIHANRSKKDDQNTTRVIIFSQFRDSVEEIMHMLKQLRPLIRPASFIGQSSRVNSLIQSPNLSGSPRASTTNPSAHLSSAFGGISQRDQIRVMESFRAGVFNTLVSTCVGEEGIDVGQVDLIVCFDAFKSPIRLMQRLGRTGRKRFGRIVMLLTEGREERNHAVSMARTSSVHKALLQGNAYRRLAFYPHNPRMVPLNINPKLEFCALRNSSRCVALQTELKSMKKVSKIAQNVSEKSSKLDYMNRFHADLASLNIYLRLHPLSLSHLSDSCIYGPNWPTLTEMYHLNSSSRFSIFRENLQSSLKVTITTTTTTTSSTIVGSSYSTKHLVAIFRLIEMHRLNLTQLHYHALGLRSIDVNTNFSKLIENKFEQCETQTQSSQSVKPSENTSLSQKQEPNICINNINELNVSKPELCDNNFTFISSDVPKLIKGLVSEQLIIDPRLHEVNYCVGELDKIISQPDRDYITIELLRNAWSKWFTYPETKEEDNMFINREVHSSPKLDLKLNIENSLLEAINGELDPIIEDKSPTHNLVCSNKTSPVDSRINHLSANQSENSNIFKNFISTTSLARSTPYTNALKKNFKNLPFESYNSQINLDEALVLLNNSTIQLNTSSLLEDQNLDTIISTTTTTTTIATATMYSNNHNMQTNSKSIIFPGFMCSDQNSSTDLFTFKTKLSFDDELEELVKPTQNNSTPNKTIVRNMNSDDSDNSFSSQINWSPIIVPTNESLSNMRHNTSLSFEKNTKYDLGQTFHKSPSLEISDIDLLNNELNLKNGNCPNSPLSNKSNLKQFKLKQKKPNYRTFFLTQAQCKENESDDEASLSEQDLCDDDSFIDNRIDEEQDSLSHMNHSDMMGIYLQTIRSPNRNYPNFFQPKNRKVEDYDRNIIPKTSSPGKSNLHSIDLIFSQMPEQDDSYELDSFCVDDEYSSFHSPNKTKCIDKNKIRKRVRTGSESRTHQSFSKI